MNPFCENAFYLLVWRSLLAALIAVVLMSTCSFQLAVALLIGANVSLLCSLGLVAWSEWLSDERLVSTEAWRMLKPAERPAGEAGRRWARSWLKDLSLRFAKAASIVAITLSASALVFTTE